MTVPDSKVQGVTYFLGDIGREGFMLSGNDLCGVFAHPKRAKAGAFSRIIEAAAYELAKAGFDAVTLDCFQGLAGLYSRYGFAETGRAKFDHAYAPAGWADTFGEPDVVFMAAPVAALQALAA